MPQTPSLPSAETTRPDLSPLPPPDDSDAADRDLAARALAGDMGAFDALVTLYSDRVYAVAFRMLGDRAEAEDLSQEVFVAIYHHLDSFRGESKLSTWVYRITKNRCLNRLKFLERRRHGRHADLEDPAIGGLCADPSTLAGQHRDPVRLASQKELEVIVQATLLELPEEQRTVVVLRDLEGLSYEEIVEITGLALGTVKSRLHRARERLAELLAPSLSEHSPELLGGAR